ncbi:hypothetical protein EWM64_g10668 [Hericium alpestre]|uniref:Major facilitator superfamily (MFS) profile domain-containing protein n=1 Tax=Hericium alpestre TaxID=135208 RepID=A0A4Y9ZFZ4_9AGAM|nr:hypothetical protein EWM64_g10668 [Hericium alpestre]
MATAATDATYIDDKKDANSLEHIERRVSPARSDVTDGELLGEQRAQAEKKLVRKLDMRLLPTIIVIFIMNYIDRTAVTAARLKGLEQDLHLTDLQYNVILAVLYASYCPAQIPSNMVRCSFELY